SLSYSFALVQRFLRSKQNLRTRWQAGFAHRIVPVFLSPQREVIEVLQCSFIEFLSASRSHFSPHACGSPALERPALLPTRSTALPRPARTADPGPRRFRTAPSPPPSTRAGERARPSSSSPRRIASR